MANAIYPSWKEALLQFSTNNNLSAGDVRVALIDTGVYTFNSSHQFLDDISGVVGTSPPITTKTFTNGIFDGDNVVFSSVSGSTVEAVILYIDTGVASTSPLVAFLDTGFTGLPFTPNGGNVELTWDSTGIFQL